jgi:alpha-methylacyl-CoA racemase
MLLADMGAEVTVIDRPATSNPSALVLANAAIMNRGKKSIALDLKMEGGRDVVLRLLENANGLIEGFRPGVMERLGLGPGDCLEVNPRLVYGRMTGWGQAGPLSQVAGHDLNYVALSGALWYGGRADSPPTVPPTLVGDMGGGAMLLAIGMLAAMMNAQETGKGQVVDAAMIDGSALSTTLAQETGKGQVVDAAMIDGSALSTTLLYALFQSGNWTLNRQDNFLDGAAYWYDTYECADGKYVSIGSIEPEFHALLLEKLGLEDDPDFAQQYKKDRWPELKARFVDIFKTKTRDEWCALLEGSDVCFAPVLDFAEAPRHPHNRARGVFTKVAGVTQPAPAPRFSETPSEIGSAPPESGEHTAEILAAAGYSEQELGRLRAMNII